MEQQSSPTTILMLSANPKGTNALRLDEERRDVEAGLIERSRLRDQFRMIPKFAVRPRDVQRAMLDYTPQIVHFSGHGGGEAGLKLEDETGQVKFVDAAALAALFDLFADQLQCVLLNACYSEVQAKAIAQHIPYVIGMSNSIGDKAAIEFAVGFYDALGSGRDIEFAYKNACVAIQMAGIPQEHIPVLHCKPGLSTPKPKTATTSLSQTQSCNLTEKQKSLLRWIVEEVHAGRLNEEQIWILWTLDGTGIVGYEGNLPEIKSTTLNALQQNGLIVCDRSSNNEYRFTLTNRAYEVVASFPESQIKK